MSFSKNLILASIASIFVALTSTATFAAPAISKSSLNIRSGPGTGYRVVDTLYRGEKVNVGECVSNGWCYITHKGPDGWVSAKYLRAVANRPQTPKRPQYNPPRRPQQNPPVSFGFSMNSDGNFTFGLGIGGAPTYLHRPPTPLYSPPAPEVCFYRGANYSGQQYCVTSGTAYGNLPARWDNSISSIKVKNGASVKVCRWEDFSGGCRTYNSSKSNLGTRFNNRISSFRIY